MMLRRFAVAAVVLQASASFATAPFSPTTDAVERAALPEIRLPLPAVREQVAELKHEPLRFAIRQPLAFDLRHGLWDSPASGWSRWRLRIESEGARSLALQLAEVQLPTGAALWFYDGTGQDVQGPFDRDSAMLRSGHLPLVRSSSAVLEVRAPTEVTSQIRLDITAAFHGYRGLTGRDGLRPKAAIGEDSGNCNINVVCPEGNSWRDEIRSTVLLTVGGTTFCTGSLINNTRRDDRPLVLTANHCGLRSNNVTTTTAYFNTQSAACGGNDDGRVDQNIAGSTFLARDENSDFTLYTLARVPPSAFNAFYAGWDARAGVAPQSGVTLHHPSGDEKKITLYSTPGVAEEDVLIGSVIDGFRVDAWRITWARATTEAGSSGSGLFNQNKQLVGVLSGGGASCSAPNEADFFGRMDRGFTANTASSGQLKAHLDPINTGCLTLAGKNPGNSTPLGACTAPPSPSPNPTPSPSPAPTPTTSSNDSSGGSPGLLLLGGLLLAGLSRAARRV